MVAPRCDAHNGTTTSVRRRRAVAGVCVATYDYEEFVLQQRISRRKEEIAAEEDAITRKNAKPIKVPRKPGVHRVEF